MSVYTSLTKELRCPVCGETNTHVNSVNVACRPGGEDGPIVETGVGADGLIAPLPAGTTPVGEYVGVGRRHRIALLGWCETCAARFALIFTQHKGTTFVESRELTDGLRESA